MKLSRLSPAVRRVFFRLAGAALLTAPALLASGAAGAFDADSDTIVDEADAYPCDANSASVSFAPAQGQFGMLLFEDQWPSQGDLDFNDAALAYNYVFEQDSQGRVRTLRLNYNLLAVGGVFNNGLGVQLPVLASTVSSVRQTIGQGASTALTAQQQDSQLTLRLLPNMRALYNNVAGPINSDPALGTQQGLPVEVEITFKTPQAIDLGQAPFDVFIFRTEAPTHEIHRPQYPGTALMDSGLFGSDDDGSTIDRHFVDRQGLPFALTLPGIYPWSREGVGIHHLYPNIVQFAASGGTQARDFYTTGVDLSWAYGWTQGPQDMVQSPWQNPVPAAFVGADTIPAQTACVNAWGLSVEFGTTRDTYGYASAMDASGNVIVTGYTRSSFDGFSNQGGQDIFVAKYNRTTGARIWARQYGGSGNDSGRGVAVDASGNIYVVGETRSALNSQTNAGLSDGFLMRLSSDGTLQWTRTFGGSADDGARGVAVNSSGVFVGGASSSTNFPGATYPGNTPSSFLVKFDASGTRLWSNQYRTDTANAANYNYTTAIAVDASGNVYATGGEHRYNRSPSAAVNPFLVRHNGDTGAVVWTQHVGDYGYYQGIADFRFATAFGLTTTAAGDVYLAGHWEAGTTVSSWGGATRTGGDRSSDLFLTKFTASGTQQWTQSVGSAGAKADYGLAVTADTAGNAYLVGYTAGALPGQTAGGNYDYYVARYDGTGNRTWLTQYNTTGDDGAFGAAVDASAGMLYVVGNTGPITGNPVSLTNQYFGFISRHNLGTGARDLFNLTANINAVRTSCQAILAGGLGSTSGVYTIDPDGTGPNAPYDVYCDMTTDGGGWTLVFNHHIRAGYFGSAAQAASANESRPTADMYSIIRRLEEFRRNGAFTFKINWPGYSRRNIWSQTTNPTQDVSVGGYQGIDIQATQGYGWAGLELGNGSHGPANGGASYLDGSSSPSGCWGCWYYAIGSFVVWYGGIPAADDVVGASGVGVPQVQLWVR